MSVPARKTVMGKKGGRATGGGPASLRVFRDITVVPTQSFRSRIARGGPIWPGFDRQTGVRQCRRGAPVDARPDTPASVTGRIDAPCVWGGFLDRNFGHLMAEHLPRLPFALQQRADDLYLFTVEPGQTAASLPDHIWDLLAWYGVPRDRVRIVETPLCVATLRAGTQAETLPNVAPSPAYLDLLDRIAERNGLRPQSSDLLYVTRAGLPAEGLGGHAGEGYLVSVLQALGVDILNPARAPIRQQLSRYAGAKRLVFAEGSALHGRQALGRVDQDIHVLRRRPRRWMARAMIAPRCRALRYHDTAGAVLMAYYRNGTRQPDPALALYDLDALFAAFDGIGLDLRPAWNHDAYRRAVASEARAWIKARQAKPQHLLHYIDTLAQAGFDLDDADETTARAPLRGQPGTD